MFKKKQQALSLKEMPVWGWAGESKEVSTNLFQLLYVLVKLKKKKSLWISLWNVLISVELPCIIHDYKMIWISGGDRFSDEDFKLCNYETHIG